MPNTLTVNVPQHLSIETDAIGIPEVAGDWSSTLDSIKNNLEGLQAVVGESLGGVDSPVGKFLSEYASSALTSMSHGLSLLRGASLDFDPRDEASMLRYGAVENLLNALQLYKSDTPDAESQYSAFLTKLRNPEIGQDKDREQMALYGEQQVALIEEAVAAIKSSDLAKAKPWFEAIIQFLVDRFELSTGQVYQSIKDRPWSDSQNIGMIILLLSSLSALVYIYQVADQLSDRPGSTVLAILSLAAVSLGYNMVRRNADATA